MRMQRKQDTMADSKKVSGDEAANSGIQSEEDLQRMIEEEAWYDSDDEASTRRLETDSEAADPDPSLYCSETNWKLLWQVDKDEDDLEFNSPSATAQLPHTHTDIVEDILTQLTKVEGWSQILQEEFGGQHAWTGGRIQADSGDDDSLQTVVAKLIIDTEEEAPHVPADLSTHVVFDGESPLEAEPKKPKYYRIAHELLASERTYVQGLRFMEKVVHGAVKAKLATKEAILSASERKEIFINVGEIYALNFDLLQELEKQLKNWHPRSLVADVIAKRAPFFKLYSVYMDGYDKANNAYQQRLNTSKLFVELMKIIEDSPVSKGLKVSSFMILPIQRFPRYKLLLEDYIKHLPKDHPDLVNAKAALAAVSDTLNYMNSRITEVESQAVLLKIQQQLAGNVQLGAPGRKYVGVGSVEVVSSGKKNPRILFLFTDILLVTSLTNGKYKIHHKFSLKNLLVRTLELVSSPVKNGFCIAEKGQVKPMRFTTKLEDERDLWIKVRYQKETVVLRIMKLNTCIAASSDHFVINRMSKFASVLYNPLVYRSILEVLNDLSFERSQPSWVRRSRHSTKGVEETDQPVEEIKTEFEDENKGERALLTMSLNPGIDNSLSSYMNQRSKTGEFWKERWFVLNIITRTLVCYDNHLHDEAIGAIPLAGYKLSLPTEDDNVQRLNVLKLTHLKNRTYFFQLPSGYDYEKWSTVLKELLACIGGKF